MRTWGTGVAQTNMNINKSSYTDNKIDVWRDDEIERLSDLQIQSFRHFTRVVIQSVHWKKILSTLSMTHFLLMISICCSFPVWYAVQFVHTNRTFWNMIIMFNDSVSWVLIWALLICQISILWTAISSEKINWKRIRKRQEMFEDLKSESWGNRKFIREGRKSRSKEVRNRFSEWWWWWCWC